MVCTVKCGKIFLIISLSILPSTYISNPGLVKLDAAFTLTVSVIESSIRGSGVEEI